MWNSTIIKMLIDGIGETLYMTLGSTFLGYLFGLPMGILLTVSDKDGLKPNAVLYKILDVIANLVRSIPFLILLILIIGSIIMISLGIIGYYIAKIYEEVKGRPRYLIEKRISGADGVQNKGHRQKTPPREMKAK